MAPSESSPSDKPYDLVIVGAGIHGIIALQRYHQANPNHAILLVDSSPSIGGVWSSERVYPNLLTHNYYGTYEYSDFRMLPNRLNKFGYIGALTVAEYIKDYVSHFNLDQFLRMGITIEKIERLPSGGFNLNTKTASNEPAKLSTKRVIIATGLTSDPFIPSIPTNSFQPPTYHFRDLPAALTAFPTPTSNPITVYGGSKSAFDAIHAFLTLGHRVNWIIRATGAGPCTTLPPTVLGINSLKFAHTRFFSWLNPSIYALHTNSSAQRFLSKNWLGRKLFTLYWRWISTLTASYCGFDKSENGRKLVPTDPDMCAFWISGNVGVAVHEDLYGLIHDNPNLTIYRNSIESLEGTDVVLDDGTRLETDAVVFATGWKIGSNPFDEAELSGLGLPAPLGGQGEEEWAALEREAEELVLKEFPVLANPPQFNKPELTKTPYRLYRRMIPPSEEEVQRRDIVFLGKVHTGSTAMLAEVQALWAVAYFNGDVAVPGEEERRREVAEFGVWCGKRYLALGRKMPFTLYDYQTYIDALLLDMGLNPNRKGWFKPREWLEPYMPRDYKGLLDEYLKLREKRLQEGGSGKTKSD